MEKFSYSKISTYTQCPFRYKLVYVDKHFINEGSIATEFGSLIHYIEEHIGQELKNHHTIDYDMYLDILMNGNEDIVGANKIKDKYKDDWGLKNKENLSYEDKLNAYINIGIYRLEKYLKDNPSYEIFDTELKFEVEYKGHLFTGSIDRIIYDKDKDTYIIEDIKTYSKKLTPKELSTALQMFIYKKALTNNLFIDAKKIKCFYDLALLDIRQQSTIQEDRIDEDLDKTFIHIIGNDFHPIPTPLCHWCPFCKTNPAQPKEAQNLCPYYSHWTRENKDNSVENRWKGESEHTKILEEFINKYSNKTKKLYDDVDF